MTHAKFTVSIIIPNWNGAMLLQKNLGKVIANSSAASEIIVVDDASVDNSCEVVEKNFPNIILVKKTRNEGFAAGVNAGAARATGDILYLMNTDVYPDKGYLEALFTHFQDPAVFAVGSLEKSHENEGIVLRGRGISSWRRGFYIHKLGDVKGTKTAWVSGGSGAFRRSMWQKLGGMDAIYNPFYWEDIDLSYRALKAGFKTLFEPKSIVHHLHEAGTIKSSFSHRQVKTVAYRNQFIFHWKNMTDVGLCITHVFWLPVRLVQALFRSDTPMIMGFLAAVFKLGPIFVKRLRAMKYWKISDISSVLPI